MTHRTRERREAEREHRRNLAGLAVGLSAPGLLNKGATEAAKKVLRPSLLGESDLGVVAKEMGFKKRIPLRLWDEAMAAGHAGAVTARNAAEAARKAGLPEAVGDVVVTPLSGRTSEAFLAHELGHIKNSRLLDKLRVGALANKIRGASTTLLRKGGWALPGVLTAKALGEEDPSWVPGALHAAVMAPVTIGEGVANARAVKHMVGKYGLKKGLSMSRQLAPAYASYLALTTTPLLATAGKKLYNRTQKEKKSSVRRGEEMSPRVSRLRSLSKTAAALRSHSLRKEAGLLGSAASLVGRGAKSYGNALVADPLKTLGTTAMGGMLAYGGVKAGQGAYHKQMAGMDPNVHKMLNGSVPTPPGV